MGPNRIREHRERAGYTLEELAERVGTSFQQVSRLEKGERRLTDEWLGRLSVALSVRKADLIVDFASLPPEDREFTQDGTEARLLRAWRGLDAADKAVVLRYLDRISGP